ncbi:MAG: S26 family signal peptidase [Dysgonamonadaceae bacterium]|jgi:signal peptidase I|nr:S26 family signal peptidase [Dysgonamonadaceae bacterium]
MSNQSSETQVETTAKKRVLATKKSQWIKFSIITLLYVLFVIWDNNYWLLFGIPLIFDIYISKVIPWDGWKKSENKVLKKIADWVDAIVFALIAVYFINIFIFQNYQIPSSSLEKTLLVGDFLFVSKVSYGPRVPNTPLAFPLTHHTLPIINTKSYSDWPSWDYKRLKGFGTVKRNDIVVFNFPAGDTVAVNVPNPDYYDLVYHNGRERVNSDRGVFGKVVYRPVDRRENFVKRCVGMPGDTIRIIDNKVYIDNVEQPTPKGVQYNYFVETRGQSLTEKQFQKLGVSKDDRQLLNHFMNVQPFFEALGITKNEYGNYNPVYRLPLTQEAYDFLKRSDWFTSIRIESDRILGNSSPTYPYSYNTGWTRDNFGPLWIPAAGETILLTDENIALYSRCIVNYEGNVLRKDGNKVYLNGVLSNSYTFKYDYYFMMGDNRHNSADSRAWGFVPEDHIVGKPILIWMSLDKDKGLFGGKIRWNRLFRMVDSIDKE